MTILVAFASRHGATQGIAERIGERLRVAGFDTEVAPVRGVRRVDSYQAFVVGSAVYMFRWLRPASRFVQRNRHTLSGRPLWLFSSGPVGPDEPDEQGVSPREAAVPKNMSQTVGALGARDHHVFFGAFDPTAKPVGLSERILFSLPAGKTLPSGDFRDWSEIEAWADDIAQQMAHEMS